MSSGLYSLEFLHYFFGFSSGLSDTCYLTSSLSDGKTVGACLDRNGLRPARYWRTSDNFVYVASEVFHMSINLYKVPFLLNHNAPSHMTVLFRSE